MALNSVRRTSAFVVTAACAGMSLPSARAATATFDGGAAGTGTALASRLNWVGDVLPADGDSILIASATVSATNTTGIVTGAAGTARELYLNNSLTGTGGGVAFTGTPPTKSFLSLTFGTADAATTKLPAGIFVYNGFNSSYVANNTIRVTGEPNGTILNLDAGAAATAITFASGTFGVTTYEFAGATPATNLVNVAAAASRFVFSAVVTGTGGLTKTGAGAIFLNNAANTIGGDFFANAGSLGFGNGGAFGTSTNTTHVADAGTLTIDSPGNVGDTIAAIHTFDLQGPASRVFVGAGESWTIAGAVGGPGALNKAGTGTLNLNGPIAYAGGTAVTAGTLNINSTLTSATPVTNLTGTTLGGIGTIVGDLAVGGTLLPGNANVGTLGVTGNVTLSNGTTAGTFRSNFATTNSTRDILNVSGAFNITGGTFALGNLNSQGDAAYVIASYGSLVGGAFTAVTGLVGGYSIDYNYQGLNQIALLRGNTTLYFTGNAGTDLGTAANFSTDAAGANPTTQTPTASADVYFNAAANNPANFNTGIGAGTYVNSLTFGINNANVQINSTSTGTTASTVTIKAANLNYPAGTGIVVVAGSGQGTIAANVAVAASQTWTNNSTAPLTVTGNVALGVSTLTLTGPGGTAISGIVSGSGALAKAGTGTATLSGANTYSGVTTVAGGTLRATVPAYAIFLPVSPAATAGVDVQKGRLVLDYTGGTTPVAQVKTILDAGYTNNFTTGQIRSSTATTAIGLAYGDNGTGAVTVMSSYYGDATLDGTVDFNDFLALQANFGAAATRYDQGNFNYDGFTDFNDFLVLQSNFGSSVNGTNVLVTSEQVSIMNAFFAAETTAVPEPASLAVLGLGATALLRRRRA